MKPPLGRERKKEMFVNCNPSTTTWASCEMYICACAMFKQYFPLHCSWNAFKSSQDAKTLIPKFQFHHVHLFDSNWIHLEKEVDECTWNHICCVWNIESSSVWSASWGYWRAFILHNLQYAFLNLFEFSTWAAEIILFLLILFCLICKS